MATRADLKRRYIRTAMQTRKIEFDEFYDALGRLPDRQKDRIAEGLNTNAETTAGSLMLEVKQQAIKRIAESEADTRFSGDTISVNDLDFLL